MLKSGRLFRYIWRINATLILLAGVLITISAIAVLVPEIRRSLPHKDPLLANPASDDASSQPLQLGHAELVPGTDVVKAELQTEQEAKGFSSSGYSETRNILFIDPGEKNGRWLLPDNEHLIENSTEVPEKSSGPNSRIIATAALVKPIKGTSKDGRLLLFDATGKRVVEVSTNTTQIRLATLAGNDLLLLFEQGNRLIRASFDPASLTQRNQKQIEIPKFK